MIEPCTLPIIFELTHTADLSDWKGERSDAVWHSLVSDLRRHIGPAKEETPVQAAPEKQPEAPQPAAPVATPPVVEAKPEAAAPAPPVVEAKPEAPASAPPVEAKAADLQPEKQEEKAKTNGKALKASQEDLAQALEKFSKAHGSVLLEPTHAEESQTKFFKQSDEFRQTEGGNVHCLRRIHAPDGEAPYVVGPAGLKIGRTAPADIVASEPSVSRQHCVIEFAADKLRVTDLNSTNGTYIDNKRVEGSQILPVGSVLRVGNVSFEHEVHDRAEFERQNDPPGFNLGSNDQEPRTARSS